MDENQFLGTAAPIEAAFEAIKAKHENLHARFPQGSDPVLLELADMILLFSAQMTMLAKNFVNIDDAPQGRKINRKAKQRPPIMLS